MSPQSPYDAQDDPSGLATTKTAVPESLACNGCRKAKLRCSRDRPSCSHCRKTGLECVYETKRTKPGLKAGAVENLHRRLDALEKAVHERDSVQTLASTDEREHSGAAGDARTSAAFDILALLAKELPKLVGSTSSHTPSSTSSEKVEVTGKRRRLENDGVARSPYLSTSPKLPDQGSLEAIISAYFSQIHPWIPMVHQGRFRQRLLIPLQRTKLEVLLHSMIIAANRFVADNNLTIDDLSQVRKWVVWAAMDDLSVESLQALIILAWTDIGDGNSAQAWSIIGSLSRTVEYSQLSQEYENRDGQTFCQPYDFLDYPEDWTEAEERRRIFWNVFNLDRFCSVTMGWNTSLTSDDVHRRLPCDGHLWRKRKPVVTPYFGIWDRSAGRIGKPIVFLPHYDSPEQNISQHDHQGHSEPSPAGVQSQTSSTDMSTVGAFAYCIEATESMSRITSYFLQQKIDLNDQRDIRSWLTRFKELDLRLVHWRMLLPQKWKTHMERQTIIMDPNLTTAHLTHNASMILLHQLIAYPPATWLFRSRLPTAWSAETCYSAGVEIARIARNYLTNSKDGSPVGNQFSFCLFIAGRMMLVHWRYDVDNELPEEFSSLVQSLEDMSRRWRAFSELSPTRQDLSARYAAHLKEMYEMCVRDESFRINVMGYTKEISHHPKSQTRSRAQVSAPMQRADRSKCPEQWSYGTSEIPDIVSGVNIPVPVSPQDVLRTNMAATAPLTINTADTEILHNDLDNTDFNSIPQMMLDQHFINMDRIIAFDDGSMFAANLDQGAW